MTKKYSIGLDLGTNSARALLVDVQNGEEVASHVSPYDHGDSGVITNSLDPNLARQHPSDYINSIEAAVTNMLAKANLSSEVIEKDIIGIGVDATASTPLPVDGEGTPLAFLADFEQNLSAMAWLWKDHTAFEEAKQITDKAKEIRPQYLAKCGGVYSSEWFWSKILYCLHTDPEVYNAATTWVELADWVPAELTATCHPSRIKRGVCAAGHKGLYNATWGGYPDRDFLESIDPRLISVRDTLSDRVYTVMDSAGGLSPKWSKKLGLPEGLPVAVGVIDAHMGGIGSGIQPGVLVKILGTSTCDMMVAPLDQKIDDIPGISGIVPESILPEALGMEAGQSAVGDIFNWYVSHINPNDTDANGHEELTEAAQNLRVGQSGLLCLDWHNGNRSVLIDQRLTGLMVGLTLQTKPHEVYRALIEGTAFGARKIIEQFEAYGVNVKRIINCGGIAVKNKFLMQIYADVLGRPMEISSALQTCALGAAIAGAVVAGSKMGGYDDFGTAIASMTSVQEGSIRPNAENTVLYDRIYKIYNRLHDLFGTSEYTANMYSVMKELLEIRDQALSNIQ